MLKPQDIVVLLKLHSQKDPGWSFPRLAAELGLSPATVHDALQSAGMSRLYDPIRKEPLRAPLAEFLVHGLKYVFPAKRGPTVRGMPTGFAAPPLANKGIAVPTNPPVWPFGRGEARGYAVEPLFKTVPLAASRDEDLYRLLALIDAIRDGSAREQKLAAGLLREELGLNANE